MVVLSASKITEIAQGKDRKAAILTAVGDLSKQIVANDLVLVGTYIGDEKTAGGIYRPTDHLKEDEYQSKVGLVLKRGPYAYSDWEDDETRGQNAVIGTWVVFAIKDTWPLQFNGTPVRFVPYERIRMVITEPKLVF